jgi:hypothetical protein
MNRFRTVTALALLALISTVVRSQEPPPSVTTIPSPPVAGSPFTVDASFLGAGGTPTFPFEFAYVFGDSIAISGVPEDPLVYGQVSVTVPPMQAGTYNLQFTTVQFSPRPNWANFQIVVVPQGAAVLSPTPVFSTAGISLCTFTILLGGIVALIFRRPRANVNR